MTRFRDAISISGREGSAYLTPICGGSNPVTSYTVCWIHSLESCDSDINNYTTSNSLRGGSDVAIDTLLLTSDRRLLL